MQAELTWNSTARRPKIYLAGPEVFHAAAIDIGRRKKEICAKLGLEGLFPLDNEIPSAGDADPLTVAERIYDANIAMIAQADGVIANITPFLGALADDGTAFEIGFAVARNLPVALYDNGAGDTVAKAAELARAAPALRDPEIAAEDFGLPVNLMLAVAAKRAIGVETGPAPLRLGDLSRFERAVRRLAATFASDKPNL